MKKALRLLLVLTLVVTCIACDKKIKPFDLKDEYYEKSEIIDLTLEELQKKQEDKDSFVLYVYLEGCSSCAEFKEVLKEFQETNNLTIYSCEIKEAIQTELKDKIKYAPSFVVYKDGKILSYLDAESDEDLPYYKTPEQFKEWLTKYINLK